METTLQKIDWTNDQLQLIKKTVASGATDNEFQLFLYMARKYNLDPLTRKIWLVKYGTASASIFTGRDGFLQKAHESGQFNGMKTVPQFDDKGLLISATCTVWRKDMQHPIEVTVWNKEYNTGKSNWARMAITMLSKVAESQALRKAFDISGIYAEEEEQAIAQTQTVDVKGEEILSEDLVVQIATCDTEEQLMALYKANKNLQGKVFFRDALAKRKAELQPKDDITNPKYNINQQPEPQKNTKADKIKHTHQLYSE